MTILDKPNRHLFFDEALTIARRRADLSQHELAEKMGVHKNTISNWENWSSKPNGEQYQQLVNLLDLDRQFDLRTLRWRCTPISAGQAA